MPNKPSLVINTSPLVALASALAADKMNAMTDKHICEHAAEQGVSEEEALKRGMEEKSNEFVRKKAEVYSQS